MGGATVMNHTRIIPTSIQAVIFDCGGTLLDLEPGRETVCARVLASMGLVIAPNLIRRAYRTLDFALPQQSSRTRDIAGRRQFYDEFNWRLAVLLGVESHATELNATLQAAFGPGLAHWRLVDGAAEVLAHLRNERHLPLFVLANWDRHLSVRLQENGILDHFDAVYDSQTLGSEKPDRAIFDAFFRQTGLEPQRSIYVGNEYLADVVGSRRVGMVPVLLSREEQYPPECDCIVVNELRQLLQLLRAQAGSSPPRVDLRHGLKVKGI
jgi:putative hydrolase of the HAD superfamily